MTALCAAGLMSGTSMDGIDLAMIVTDGDRHVERGPTMTIGYEAPFRHRLAEALRTALRIVHRDDRPGDLRTLEQAITSRHGEAVRRFLADQAGSWARPQLIGFHGQTVLHRPQQALTVQLGEGTVLARELGLPVVYDMRANDMRHGGQGAPLVPAYHAALAGTLPDPWSDASPVAFVNIGGISNVTWIARDVDPVAFDAGPGNALIDQWVFIHGGVPFDADGVIASEGAVANRVVERYLDAAFFERPAPKSLDRNDFGLDEAAGLDLADGARTLAAVSAGAILRAADHLPAMPRLWIASGGGRKNPHILADLKHGAEKMGSRVMTAEDVGLNGDSMEAEAWAYLAVRSLKGYPLTYPTTTGCSVPVTGGILARP